MKRKKDYYIILGVSRSESAEGIKAAFRKLAKKHHPDMTGPEGTRRFQELAEAYEVLSDPGAREEYTEQLRNAEEHRKTRRAAREHPGRPVDPFSELRKSKQFSSLSDVLIDALRMGGPFSAHSNPRAVFDLELILSPEEARKGGIISTQIPVRYACPACEGTGGFFFVCPDCGGGGIVDKTASFRISIPPEVKHETLLHAHVGTPSRPVHLRIRVLVR